jgi:hypothetical protein
MGMSKAILTGKDYGVMGVEVHEDSDGCCAKCGKSNLVYVWHVVTRSGESAHVGAECGRQMLGIADAALLRGSLAKNARCVRSVERMRAEEAADIARRAAL